MNTSGIHLKKKPFSAPHVNKLIEIKKYDAAESILRKELKKKPNNHEAQYLLGVTLWNKENYKGALVFLKRAHGNASSTLDIQRSSLALSNVYDSQKQYKLAVQTAEKGLKGTYAVNKLTAKLVNLIIKTKDWDRLHKIIVALKPLKSSSFEALKLICLAHQAMGEIEVAIQLALEEQGNFPESSILLTQFYNELGEFDKTESLLQHSLKYKPGDSHLSSSLANLYGFQGKLKEAKDLLSEIKLSNNISHIKWHLGSLYLSEGDFKTAHPLMEARYNDPLSYSKVTLLKAINFNVPLPESMANLLVSKEEGIGDQIRNAKYLSMLPADIKQKIFVNCEDRLIPLFEESFPELKFISSKDMNLAYMVKNNVTHQTLLASTYFLLDQDMQPAQSAYIKINHVNELLTKTDKIKIGLCWRSVKAQLHRTLWYMPLEEVAALFKDIDCELISLQNDVSDEELNIIKQHSGKDLIVTDVDAKDDFLRLSQLINEVDLVISTATATSELSSALGKKTWVIGNKHPLRWYLSQMYMDHFYPDMKLYLSTQAFDWSVVASEVRGDLENYVGGECG